MIFLYEDLANTSKIIEKRRFYLQKLIPSIVKDICSSMNYEPRDGWDLPIVKRSRKDSNWINRLSWYYKYRVIARVLASFQLF